MTFIRQEGGKEKFIDDAFLLQPAGAWTVLAEPFAGSAAVGMAFAELYPDREFIIGDDDQTIVNAFQQVRNNVAEVQEWAWRYSHCLKSEDHTRWLWARWTESRDNPEQFSPSQRAALRIHAGPIGSLSALNEYGRKSGFSPSRAGFRGNARWIGLHAVVIEELARWSGVLQRADVRLTDYRDLLTAIIEKGRKAFVFADPPYRKACKGRLSASRLYYGKQFDVNEFGRQCQRTSDAGHAVMVTLDWCDENAAMFGADWTVMKASWASYAGALSEHLVAINYSPLIPAVEVAVIKGWSIAQIGRQP